jgi:hypothetical protein
MNHDPNKCLPPGSNLCIALPTKSRNLARSVVYAAERFFPGLRMNLNENTFELILVNEPQTVISTDVITELKAFITSRCEGSGAFLNRLKEKTFFINLDGTVLYGNSTTMIMNQGVTGSHLLKPEIMRTMRLLDRCLLNFHQKLGATEVQMPSIVSHQTLTRAGYLPRDIHQVGEILVQNRDSTSQSNSHVCLSPALCLSCYAAFEGTFLKQPTLLSAFGQVYRYEGGMHGGSDPLTRLWEYRVRELVGFGSVDLIQITLERYLKFIERLALTFQLPSRAETATDLFFHGEYANIAAHQLMGSKKIEFCVNLESGPLAISSFNIHDYHFTKEFKIEIENANEQTQSFCIGFGLERCAYAIVLSVQDPKERELLLETFEKETIYA